MDANNISKKILSDAHQQADEIKRLARQQADEHKKANDKKLAQFNETTRELAEKNANETREHMFAASRMENAKKDLTEKRAALDAIFKRSADLLKKMPKDEYIGLMTKFMVEAVQSGDEEVIVDKTESHLDQLFIKNVNRQLGPGYKGNLSLAENKYDIGAGFILKRGRILTNVSLPVLINQAREELEPRFAKELFAD